ncbi:hypothetical protein Angca_001163 [Angiostrongylus cantonensis]|nr:hypothetical protein Angca_001163 [Angiostrongylus cantonensis]
MSSTNISLEEDSGVIKSGPVVAGFAPIKSRKTYYAVLCERALELHDSEKTYRKGKSARYLIDLSIAFNLHNEHLDPKLKRCVCLMGPDETLCLKVDDADLFMFFLSLQRKCVAFFGCQERFFLMRLGRGSPMGASELWAQCESEEVAHDIHNRLNVIIERESEKKRKMNNGVVMPPGLLSLRSHHGHHRERSHTQPFKQRTSSFFSGRVGSPASTSNGIIGRKPSGSSGPHPQQLGSRALSVSCGSQGQFGSKSHDTSLMSIFPSRDINTSVASKGDCGVYQQMGALSNLQTSTSTSTTDETENSGWRRHCDAHVECAHSPPSLPSIRGRQIGTRLVWEDSSTGSIHRPTTTKYEGYTPMHAAEWTTSGSNSHLIAPTYERYKLEEVRSYVSDSSDSCYSSMTTNGCSTAQAAYSFAGRCNLRSNGQQDGVVDNLDIRSDSSSAGLLPPPEDPRKRAFSLGSKTLFPRPFRKISQHSSRQQRHSQTSASGASLASEVSSSFGPSSSSANHLSSCICSEKDECTRNRSGSFGSGHSTPYYRKGGPSSGTRDGADHFVEIDFGSGIGRSGSGSVTSVDSPNSCVRSRTSSFGCSIRKDAETFSYLKELPDSMLTPSQIVLQQAKQSSLDESFDYVSTEAPDLIAVKNALAVAANEHSGHHHGFLSLTDSKSIDLRSSQHFETIEENASLKSSPCSSRSSMNVNDVAVDGIEVERWCGTDCIEDIGQKCTNTLDNPSTKDFSFGPYCAPSYRSASVALSEINERNPSQNSAHGLPKRSSVPTLKSHDADYSSAVLNYAFVQEAGPQMEEQRTDSGCDSSGRYRSESGIQMFLQNHDVGKSALDYASIKPI